AGGRPLFHRDIDLEETIVGARLHVGQRRHLDGITEAAEVADLLWDNSALCWDGHKWCSSPKNKGAVAIRDQPIAVAKSQKPPTLKLPNETRLIENEVAGPEAAPRRFFPQVPLPPGAE